MTQWISFADLKRQVSIEDVLVHYGLRDGLRQRRGELVGLCPFHKETRGSFSASTTKNAFQCFGCSRKGNILDFVAVKLLLDMAGGRPKRGQLDGHVLECQAAGAPAGERRTSRKTDLVVR